MAAEARKSVKDAALEEVISVIEGDSKKAMLRWCPEEKPMVSLGVTYKRYGKPWFPKENDLQK